MPAFSLGVYLDSSGNQHGFIDTPPSTPTHLLWDNSRTEHGLSVDRRRRLLSFTQHYFWTLHRMDRQVCLRRTRTEPSICFGATPTAPTSLWNVAV